MKINEILAGYKNWHGVVVGCGGTISNFVPHLSQLLYSLNDLITITLVDEDTVEPGNVGRQFFAPPDVGNNKARTLQLRYQNAWGVRLSYHPHYIRDEKILEKLLIPPVAHAGKPTMPILIGGVDNHYSRRIMDAVFKKAENLIYLDSGNGEYTGQVVVAIRYGGKTLLKPPSEYFPEILTEQDEISVGGTCGRKAVKEPQTLVANVWAATTLLAMVNSIVNLKKISVSMTSFSALNCVSKPVFRMEAVQ
ncbi:ThiF family adenylyltransferase [Pelotomaculum propionicicum]|uniref:ThiF family adenylyltransferase n=1 Tax=Pelotomaculum propionicicum TaxID=258475 RepID=UPI003B7E9DA8